jgi:16S rRNA (cytosine967-C5)-methyltransferase
MTSLPENRRAALQLFQAVLRDHKPLDDQADQIGRKLESRDRAFVRLLVATTLRRLGQIDGVINRCLDRPMAAKLADVRDILRLGVAQMVFLNTPPHAVVDTAVQLVKDGRLAPYAGLANAVLRRVAREGHDLAAAIDETRLNTPKWLWLQWVAHYGEDLTRAIGAAHLGEAPLDISLKPDADRAEWAARLGAEILPTGSLRRLGGGAIHELDGFEQGVWWVQDAAAALPVTLLGDVAGKTVLDLCAAPGGKTAQLAAAGANVTAIDRSARRLRRVRENLARLGLDAVIQDADAIQWRPESPADAVLLDAPCSATGTIRRHPDVARLKRAQDVTDLAETQAALLRASVEMVKPGGLVIYCTCSLQPAEGEDQIAAALAAGLPFERVPVTAAEIGNLAEAITPQGDLRTLPCHLSAQGGMDGFFAARLRRLA